MILLRLWKIKYIIVFTQSRFWFTFYAIFTHIYPYSLFPLRSISILSY